MEGLVASKALAQDFSILYVEDEIRHAVVTYLKKFFVRVDTAMQMPRLNGTAMLQQIKEINPEQVSIVISD